MRKGRLAILVAMVVALCVFVLTMLFNRPLIEHQRASSNTYQATRAAQAAAGGLAWALANLNGPDADGVGACAAAPLRRWASEVGTALGTASPNPPSSATWAARCDFTREGGLVCDCGVSDTRAMAPAGVRFLVEVSRVTGAGAQRPERAELLVTATGCAVASEAVATGGCAAAESLAMARSATRVRFVPLLVPLPEVVSSSGATRPGNEEQPAASAEAAWGGYVLGAFSLGSPAAAASAMALETGPSSPSRDQVLAMPRAQLRERASSLRCDGDCSESIRRRWQSGQTVVWVAGDMQLSSALPLGTAERPLLLWVDGEARLGPGVSLTGVLMARSVVSSGEAQVGPHVRGAVVTDVPLAATGAPAFGLEWAPHVVNRLVATAGWFEPVPGGRQGN